MEPRPNQTLADPDAPGRNGSAAASPAFVRSEKHARLGRFRVLGRLGSGGMGVVYRGVDDRSGEEVAIKTVLVPRDDLLAGIRREIHSLHRIEHPGVVGVVDTGIVDGLPWYAMEFIEGTTLRGFNKNLWKERLNVSNERVHTEVTEGAAGSDSATTDGAASTTGPRPKDRAAAARGELESVLTLMCRLCEPLAFLHGEGMVHRDLKPANVVLRAGGAPTLVDFGIVWRFAGGQGREILQVGGSALGSAGYMAPEQVSGQLVDARADLYSLGCMLYESVTGRRPFLASTTRELHRQHLGVRPIPPSQLVDGVPERLDRLILQLLEKRPQDRVGHAADVARELEELGASAERLAPKHRARSYLYRPELAGRDDVLERLDGRLSTLVQGEGGRVLIGGESGVGKTRLVMELARRARKEGTRVVTGQCRALGAGEITDLDPFRAAAFHPFRELLRAVADRCASSGPQETARLLGNYGKVLAAYEPIIAALPDVEGQPEPAQLPADAARLRALAALRHVIAAYCGLGPLVLILDDLQWADELSLSFLTQLKHGFFRNFGLLVVGTYRTEEADERLRLLGEQPDVEDIALGRLEDSAVGAMVGDMLAVDSAHRPFVQFLARSSEGNPFFVAEYLRSAVAEGYLARDRNGRWRLGEFDRSREASDFEALDLPRSLKQLVARRLHGLSEATVRVVEIAAVFGREWPAALPAEVGGLQEVEWMDAVEEAITRQVIEESEPGMFRFLHDKLREAAYDGIPEERRRELHRAAGNAIEAAYTETSELAQHYSLLAHHFGEAGVVDKALHYLERAGQQALSMGAFVEAGNEFSKAISMVDATPGSLDRIGGSSKLAAWERNLGEALIKQSEYVSARDHLLRALELRGHPQPASRATMALGLLGHVARQVGHRMFPGRFVGRAGRRAGTYLRVSEIHQQLAEIAFFEHDNLGLLHGALVTLNRAEQAGPSCELAQAYGTIAITSSASMLHGVAAKYAAWAVEQADAHCGVADNAYVRQLVAVYAINVGRWQLAEETAQEATDLFGQLGHRFRHQSCLVVKGFALLMQGEFGRAAAAFEQSFEHAREDGTAQVHVWCRASLILCALARDRVATEQLTELEATLVDELEPAEILLGGGVLALAYLRRDDVERALHHADRVAELLATFQPMTYYSLWGIAGAAETYASLWQRSRVPGSKLPTEELSRKARAVSRALWLFSQMIAVARPRDLIVGGLVAWQAGHHRRAERLWRRAVAAAERWNMPCERARAHLELGSHLDAEDPDRRTHLQRAVEAFEACGAAADVAHVRTLM